VDFLGEESVGLKMGGKKEGGRLRWRRLGGDESVASWKGGGGILGWAMEGPDNWVERWAAGPMGKNLWGERPDISRVKGEQSNSAAVVVGEKDVEDKNPLPWSDAVNKVGVTWGTYPTAGDVAAPCPWNCKYGLNEPTWGKKSGRGGAGWTEGPAGSRSWTGWWWEDEAIWKEDPVRTEAKSNAEEISGCVDSDPGRTGPGASERIRKFGVVADLGPDKTKARREIPYLSWGPWGGGAGQKDFLWPIKPQSVQ